MKKSIITSSFKETQELGKKFAESLNGGAVIALRGDLGSGKTTFVQGLAQGLGVTQRIISPTFIIMRTYNVIKSSSHQAIKSFYHVDLYRIETGSDVEGLGLLELMHDPQNVIVIEWPEKIEQLLPSTCINFFFEYLEDDKRKISFE